MAASLRLVPGGVLDVGCGAGVGTVELARRGFAVDAIDPIQIMIDATRRRAMEAGLDARVTAQIGDIHTIPYLDRTFDLVVALGVLPWLPRIAKPLREISRVLRPAGYLIASVDTLWQLRQLPDPILNPVMREPRRLAACIMRRSPRGVRSYVTSLRAFRRTLASEGYQEMAGLALGFGPFTMFKREVLPSSVGLKLQDWLQSMAKRGVPIIRSSGSQYLVLARKCTAERGPSKGSDR
jgi:SAM-dependent methyltransferase